MLLWYSFNHYSITLSNYRSVFHLCFGTQKENILIINCANYQTFAHKIGNLFFGKIDNRYNLPMDQILLLIQTGNLCRRFFNTQFSKIYMELESRITCLWEIFNGNNGPNAQIYLGKVFISYYLFHINFPNGSNPNNLTINIKK